MKRNFPDWIGAYLEYTKHSEAPLKFHFWTAVGVIAGALRRKVWIEQHYFQWIPNFYIIYVSPPGIVSKSTTADIGMSLLREVPGIHFGPNSLTWQSFTKSLAECTEGVEDTSTGEITPMSAMTIVASELGSLLNFEDREMIDVFVDLWDGRRGVWHRQTKTSGEDKIANPFVNIVGCTTPAWVRENFSRYLLGGGFFSRCIFIYGHEKRHLVAYPSQSVGKEHQETRLKLIQDLEIISQMNGAYTLEPAAIAWGEEWYKGHYAAYVSSDPSDEGMASFRARKQTQIHKLGIVIAASRRQELVIKKDDLVLASKMVDAVELELPEIIGRVAERDEVKDAVTVAQILATRKSIGRQALFRLVFNRMSAQQFEVALASLAQAGRCRCTQSGNEIIITYVPPEKKSGEAPNPIPS